MTKCTTCNSTRFEPASRDRTWTVGPRSFKATVAGERCTACGSLFWNGPSIQAAEQAVARELVRQGATDGEAFRFIHEQTGILSKELAALLDVSPETISRWESGKRTPDRAAWSTLAALFFDTLEGSTATRDRLEAARAPKVPARAVRLASLPATHRHSHP